MKLNDFEKHLKNNSCHKVREGGAHSIWKNEKNQNSTSVPRHREIKKQLVKVICKQLEIPLPYAN